MFGGFLRFSSLLLWGAVTCSFLICFWQLLMCRVHQEKRFKFCLDTKNNGALPWIWPAILPHTFCQKSSPSHIYMWAKRGGTPSFNRIFLFWGSLHSFNFFLWWANQNNSLQKNKNKKIKKIVLVRHPQLIKYQSPVRGHTLIFCLDLMLPPSTQGY